MYVVCVCYGMCMHVHVHVHVNVHVHEDVLVRGRGCVLGGCGAGVCGWECVCACGPVGGRVGACVVCVCHATCMYTWTWMCMCMLKCMWMYMPCAYGVRHVVCGTRLWQVGAEW